jgi:integrase
MRGVYLEARHAADCPLSGAPKAEAMKSRRCRCSPTLRARVGGAWVLTGRLTVGWRQGDVDAFEAKAIAEKAKQVPGAVVERRRTSTLREWGESWLTNYQTLVAQGARSPRTLMSYRAAWKHIEPELGGLKLPAITPERIAALRVTLLKRYSEGYVLVMVNLLSGMLTDARGAGLVHANAAQRPRYDRSGLVPARIVRDEEPKLIELDFARALIASTEGALQAKILCGLTTGFRHREILGLQFEDLSWPEQQIRLRNQLVDGHELVPPKYEQRRTVVLYSGLGRLIAPGRSDEPWVFINPRTGRPYHQKTSTDDFNAAWEALAPRPKGHSWHVLRHTFSSLLRRHGVRDAVVDELMGHRRTDVKHLYSHAWRDERDQLEAIFESEFGRVISPVGSAARSRAR